jgi:hypothetical protein
MADADISAREAVKKSWVRGLGELFGHDDLGRINKVFIPLIAGALGAAFCVAWKACAVGPVFLWVFASLAAGGTAGFLFGIPKAGWLSKADGTPSSAINGLPLAAGDTVSNATGGAGVQRARPNTNLEEVSDWLTKILVGLTLVNLNDLKTQVHNISLNAAAAIRSKPTDSDISAATAIIVGFALIGFLVVYLYMRLFVQGAIVRSDDQMHQYRNAVARAEQIGQQEPSPDLEENEAEAAAPAVAVLPSAASLTAAQEVANAAPPNRPELVLQPLRQLASQYEAIRQSKEYSRNRTQQMAEIVQRMRPHAIAAAPYINEFIRSTSTGEHLAATVILQMRYMPEHMEWLARRPVEERAFIGYQAASALLARVRVAGVPECQAIQEAVSKTKADRARLSIVESSLDELIDQILEVK